MVLPERRGKRRHVMTAFEPKNPSYEERVRDSFARQAAMRALGVKIVALRPGEIELTMDHDAAYTQQNAFVHAGIVATAERRAGEAHRHHERNNDGARRTNGYSAGVRDLSPEGRRCRNHDCPE
jgi:hypothetical protein